MTDPLASMKIRDGSKQHTFGMVRTYPNGSPKPHQGWDLEAPVGTPVFAIHSGTVKWTRSGPAGGAYGNQILVEFKFDVSSDDHPPVSYYAFYAHLSSIQVAAGDEVHEGDQIGLTGRTGNANSPGITPHLHFEIRDTGAETPGSGLPHRLDPTWFLGMPPMNQQPGGINRSGLFGNPEERGDFPVPSETSRSA